MAYICLTGCGSADNFSYFGPRVRICVDCYMLLTHLLLTRLPLPEPTMIVRHPIEQMARLLATHPETRSLLEAAYRLGARSDQLAEILNNSNERNEP